MSDHSSARQARCRSARPAPRAGSSAGRTPRQPLSDDTRLAVEIRGLVERGAMDEARERFTGLVAAHQRRASRIAYQYLRDVAEADEAVQDAFVKVFSHIASYREAWPFEVWFTRILINGCLDRRKARARRDRWFAPADEAEPRRSEARFGGTADRSRGTAPGARAARSPCGRHRSAGRTPTHRLHAVPLRRLHASRSQRDDRPERIHRPRASVPRRAQASRPARRQVVIPAHASPRSPSVRLLFR